MTELYIAVISQTTPTTPQTLCSRNTTNRCQPAQETALGALEAPQHRREHLRVQRRRNQSPETRLVVACLATWDMRYWVCCSSCFLFVFFVVFCFSCCCFFF